MKKKKLRRENFIRRDIEMPLSVSQCDKTLDQNDFKLGTNSTSQ